MSYRVFIEGTFVTLKKCLCWQINHTFADFIWLVHRRVYLFTYLDRFVGLTFRKKPTDPIFEPQQLANGPFRVGVTVHFDSRNFEFPSNTLLFHRGKSSIDAHCAPLVGSVVADFPWKKNESWIIDESKNRKIQNNLSLEVEKCDDVINGIEVSYRSFNPRCFTCILISEAKNSC